MDGWRYTYKTAVLEGLKGYLDSISKPCEVTIVESQNALRQAQWGKKDYIQYG